MKETEIMRCRIGHKTVRLLANGKVSKSEMHSFVQLATMQAELLPDILIPGAGPEDYPPGDVEAADPRGTPQPAQKSAPAPAALPAPKPVHDAGSLGCGFGRGDECCVFLGMKGDGTFRCMRYADGVHAGVVTSGMGCMREAKRMPDAPWPFCMAFMDEDSEEGFVTQVIPGVVDRVLKATKAAPEAVGNFVDRIYSPTLTENEMVKVGSEAFAKQHLAAPAAEKGE